MATRTVVPSHPLKTAKQSGRSFFSSSRVKPKQITVFTRQFATLLEAGLPVVRSLDILQRQFRGEMRDALAQVKEDVESGSNLSESLSRQNHVFDKLFVNMVRAGEAGGVLDLVLTRLAEYREKSQTLKNRVIGAMVYPAAVTFIAAGILTFIMMFIIPRFEQMFVELGIKLPLPTEILIGISRTAVNFWYVILFMPVIIVIAYRLFVRTSNGRRMADGVKLKLPVIGGILSKTAVSRFCRTLGTLLQSGVPLLESLTIVRNTSGNEVVALAIDGVHSAVKEGDSISEPLCHTPVFDDLAVNMIAVGEETGALDRMLLKVADTYENEVDILVGAMMSLLEPAMIVFMGLTVGFIVISLFMPLIDVMKNLG
jgi:type IV pilus assembly protein PilC